MDCLDLLLLQNVTRKERENQQHDQNEQRPGAKELLGARFGSICFNHRRLDIARKIKVGSRRARTVIGVRLIFSDSS